METHIDDYGNLTLLIEEQEERDDISELNYMYGEDIAWRELFEPYFTNGSYTPINPESHFIGLTSDPYIIGEDVTVEDNGDLTVNGKLWHYPNYMLDPVVYMLCEGKEVTLTLFDTVEDLKLKLH